jgi:hypothetical protein
MMADWSVAVGSGRNRYHLAPYRSRDPSVDRWMVSPTHFELITRRTPAPPPTPIPVEPTPESSPTPIAEQIRRVRDILHQSRNWRPGIFQIDLDRFSIQNAHTNGPNKHREYVPVHEFLTESNELRALWSRHLELAMLTALLHPEFQSGMELDGYANPPGFPPTGHVVEVIPPYPDAPTVTLHIFPNYLNQQLPTRVYDPPRWRKCSVRIGSKIYTSRWCVLNSRGRPWSWSRSQAHIEGLPPPIRLRSVDCIRSRQA